MIFPAMILVGSYIYLKWLTNNLSVEKLTGGTALILAVTKGATGASSVTLSTNIITALDGPNHVSTTIEQAEHDLIVLFPDFNIPKVTMSTQLRESLTNEDVKAIETTLTIITPTAVEKYADDIIKDIESNLCSIYEF